MNLKLIAGSKTEKFQAKCYKESLSDISVSKTLHIAATCGDNAVKIYDLSNLQDVSFVLKLDREREIPDKAKFSDDGNFLTISSKEYF